MAGAVLALLASGTNGRPELEGDGGNPEVSSAANACIAYYPTNELQPESEDGVHPLLPERPSLDAFREASPISHISPAFPPSALFHGTADEVYPVSGSLRLFAAMLDSGVAAELHALSRQPHIFDRDPDLADQCAAIGAGFLDRHLIHVASAEA